jgi:hypothetical protein
MATASWPALQGVQYTFNPQPVLDHDGFCHRSQGSLPLFGLRVDHRLTAESKESGEIEGPSWRAPLMKNVGVPSTPLRCPSIVRGAQDWIGSR